MNGEFDNLAQQGSAAGYPGPGTALAPTVVCAPKRKLKGPLATAITVVVLAAVALAGWAAHWPPALFGASSSTLQPLHWSLTAAPLPADTDQTGNGAVSLNSISCLDASDCVAVGSYLTSPNAGQEPLAETLTAGKWTPSRAQPPLPGDAASSPSAQLTGLVCSSPAACTAVGMYATSTVNGQGNTENAGLIETLSGTTWSALRLPEPTTVGQVSDTDLSGLTCPAPGDCIAVGSVVEGSNQQPLIATESNGTWTSTVISLPSDSAASASENGVGTDLHSVACSGPGTCIAVGTYQNAAGGQGLIETLANGSWTPERAPLPAGAHVSGSYLVNLIGISCTTGSICVAVGEYPAQVSTGVVDKGLIETLTGGVPAAASPQSLAEVPSAEFVGVTCPGAGSCLAVGDQQVPDTTPIVATLADGVWSAAAVPVPADSPASGQFGYLSAVACPTNSSCQAVGGYTSAADVSELLAESGTAS